MAATRIKAGDIWLNAELQGPADAPVIVLHHCFAGSLAYWDFHMSAFAGYRTLRFDARGHGESDRPPGPWALDDLAGDISALMDAFGIETASICGVSMGGQAAQTLALSAPERIETLMLVNTVSEYTADQVAGWNSRTEAVLAGGVQAIEHQLLPRWFTESAIAENAPGYAYMANALRQSDPETLASTGLALARVHTTPRLHEIPCPALVVGAVADPGATKAMTEGMAEKLPQGRLVWLDPSMHLATLEHPERFNKIVRDFLDEVLPL